MSTLLDVKNDVAGQLGATDGATSVAKRDRAINRARRRFYSERKWSFCFTSATVSISSQLGSLPTLYNEKFDPECVYYYSGTTKYEFSKVGWSDVASYTSESYVYGINKGTGQIKINRTDVASLTMDYYQLPADAAITTAEDSTTELAPDIEPITALSIAYWWLTTERSTANFDRFNDLYKLDLLPKAVQADVANHAPKPINSLPNRMGYNKRHYGYVVKGYVGRS